MFLAATDLLAVFATVLLLGGALGPLIYESIVHHDTASQVRRLSVQLQALVCSP